MVAIGAGTPYALIVFLIGFVLGAIRIVLLVPRLRESSVGMEAPLLVA